MEPDEALKEVASIPLSFGRGDPATALKLAYQQIERTKRPGEILILSDMARGDWERFNLNNWDALWPK